jgi:hypothetical protein
MITIEETARTVELQVGEFVIDDAQRAAVAFRARSSGRTLDAYRHDLRSDPVGADGEPADLAATRPHIERYRLFASGLNAVILAEFAVAPIGSLVTLCAPDARCACCLSMRRREATRRCKQRRGDVRASRRCRPHQRSAWPSMTRSFLATPTGLSSA